MNDIHEPFPRFDQRMPRWLHVALCNAIQITMPNPKDCFGDLCRTISFLHEQFPGVNCEPQLAWLREHGAHCDCEVVVNTVPWDELPTLH